MLILEFKCKGNTRQYKAIDEAIRTMQFIRNSCIRYWMDNKEIGRYDLSKYCAVLAKEFPFANELNSMARQASAERAWSAIARFYDNCKRKILGKKGFPRFKHNVRSVEYKTSGWQIDRGTCKHITFTDRKKIGRLKLVGTHDLRFYSDDQIKRVRLVRRADGYYAQFCLDIAAREATEPSGIARGLDFGLKFAYADNTGFTEPNPRFYRKAEKRVAKLQRRVSKKFKRGGAQHGDTGSLTTRLSPTPSAPRQPQTNNYKKAKEKLARAYLKISRQREEWAKKVARCVCKSTDFIAYEDLKVRNMVRNSKLAKSISDIGWYALRKWIEYFGVKFGKVTVAVAPHYTSVNCFNCGKQVQKSLSTRTHKCSCGVELCRDRNAAINILQKGLSTAGHAGTWAESALNAWGDSTSALAGEILSQQVGSVNQESHPF